MNCPKRDSGSSQFLCREKQVFKERVRFCFGNFGAKWGEIIGPTRKNLAGIDCCIDDAPIQLKQLSGSSPSSVTQVALQAGRNAENAGINGMAVFIRAPNVSKEAVLNGPISKILTQQASLSTINILTKNGWVRIIR